MSELGGREHDENPLDRKILKDSLLSNISCSIYFSTLNWDKSKVIISEVLKEMESEISNYETYDQYYVNRNENE